MREFVTTTIYSGTLIVDDKEISDNVRCEYKDNYYSNDLMNGEFWMENVSIEFENNFRRSHNRFIFKGDKGVKIKGKIVRLSRKMEYGTRNIVLKFTAREFEQHIVFDDDFSTVKIEYIIPFVSILSRDLRASFGFDDSYIVKYDSNDFEIELNSAVILFKDKSNLMDYKEPDSIFHRMIYPTIIYNNVLKENVNIHIDKSYELINDCMDMLSFILNHRLGSSGYSVSFVNSKGEISETFTYKNKLINCGDEFLKDIFYLDDKFSKLFTQKNFQNIVESYINLEIENKVRFKKIIKDFIKSEENRDADALFLNTLLTLEAICRLITDANDLVSKMNMKNSHFEERIIVSANYYDINLDEYDFKISDKIFENPENKFKWLITDFRNQIVHSEYTTYDVDLAVIEYRKVVLLVRRLIFCFINKQYQNFPFP